MAVTGTPRWRLAGLGLGLMLLSILLVAPTRSIARPTSHPASARSEAKATLPNIVLILTDDERWDRPDFPTLPNVESSLVEHGVTFSNGFVVNSLCCPSRASILTGQYSHSTLVYDNGGQYGGFRSFHQDSSTIATWLHAAGYRTALLGKYLNGYNKLYIPPGWDHWNAFKGAPSGGAYYNYDLNDDGLVVHHGSSDADYSTDVLASDADSFIRGTDPSQPLLAPRSNDPGHPVRELLQRPSAVQAAELQRGRCLRQAGLGAGIAPPFAPGPVAPG